MFDQVVGEPLEVLVLVLAVDLGLDVGSFFKDPVGTFAQTLRVGSSQLIEPERFPPCPELAHPVVLPPLGRTCQHVAEQ